MSTSSTYRQQVTSPAPVPNGRRRIEIAAVILAVAVATAAVFLIRAGDPGAANWPVNWELRSSDNGGIFQQIQDFVAGRPLEWTFGPQLGIFPELPISVVAFFGAFGNIYVYYLLVACLNNVLFAAAIYMLVRCLWPARTHRQALARTALAMSPLVLLPLVGTNWIVSLHLAPGYYFGMYVVLISGPALFLIRGRWRRLALAVAIALSVASNPLTLVFAGPALAVALIIRIAGTGWRGAVLPAALSAAVVALAAFIRLVIFAPLQSASPLTYVDPTVFARRLEVFRYYFTSLMTDSSTAFVLTSGLLLAMMGIVIGLYAATRYVRNRPQASSRLLVVIYFGFMPLLGIAATYAIMITHYLYVWPVVIAPFVTVLLLVPTPWVSRVLAVVPALFLAIAVGTNSLASIGHPERYFGFRNAETTCIDAYVPAGTVAGYATFSDSRRLSLTSARGIMLVPIETDTSISRWTTNLAYPTVYPGSFFYINGAGDELAIDTAALREHFGEPDTVVSCSDSQSLWIYSSAHGQQAIQKYYAAQ